MANLTGFSKLIKFLWQNPDQLRLILENLVAVMNVTGQGMETAGNGAIAASRLFTGGPGVPVSAQSTVKAAADAVENAKEQIQSAATLIQDAANAIGNIKVPTVTPSMVTLPIIKWPNGNPVEVVGGVSVGQTSAFSGVKTSLNQGAGKIDSFGNDLQVTANNLNQLSSRLNQAGQDLRDAGESLRDSGKTLKEATTPE